MSARYLLRMRAGGTRTASWEEACALEDAGLVDRAHLLARDEAETTTDAPGAPRVVASSSTTYSTETIYEVGEGRPPVGVTVTFEPPAVRRRPRRRAPSR